MAAHLKHILLCVLWFAPALSAHAAEQRTEALTVFAAASLTDSLQKVTDDFTRATGTPVKLAFASSSVLAKQIEVGARADVFFAADPDWMNYLAQKGLIDVRSRTDLLGNRLALIVPHDSNLTLRLTAGAKLAEALGPRGRLATGDPDSVPAGRYAKAALMALGQWNDLERRLVRADNVRVALMYVARGEVPLGIVYSTDAAADSKVRVIDLFPETTHPAIVYPVAATAVAATAVANAGASRYLTYLKSDAARKEFEAAGFIWIAGEAQVRHDAAHPTEPRTR